jgi:Ig-like domain CHU_C associated/Secretion system C-terminal sorting domain
MKKLLLSALMAIGAMAASAQSKTTGTVSLQTGMTAEVNLNSGTSTATLTLTGPSDRWFALQFGSFTSSQGMASGMDVVYYNGTTLVDGYMQGLGLAPATDTNNWTVSTNTVSGTTRTIVATRAFAGGTNDFTFNYTDANIDFAYARASSATYSMTNHGSFKGYKVNQAFNCVPPDAPTATAQSFCGSATVANLTATGGTGATFSWYTTATGGTALATSTALSTGTYYVSQTLSACESTRTSVAVTVTTVNAPAATASQSFCGSATVANLSATASGGATLSWYSAATGGSALAGTTALVSGTTYYAGQTLGECSSSRTAVTVTINNTAAPTATASQTFCSGATVNDLAATGTALKWYSTIGGSQLAFSTVLTAGTYYVTQTLNNCESTTTAVNVTINNTPGTPGGNETQEFEAGETVSDLLITVTIGTTIQWYILDEDVLVEIPATTALVSGTTYYVSQSLNGCESQTLGITVSEVGAAEDFTFSGLVAYPNPASDVVTINNKAELSGVSIINMLGQEVLSQKVTGTEVQLNIAPLAGGSYIVKVTAANGASASIKIAKY